MGMKIEDVAAIATSLPEVVEGERHGTRGFVEKKAFLWERGFSNAWLACAPDRLTKDHLVT